MLDGNELRDQEVIFTVEPSKAGALHFGDASRSCRRYAVDANGDGFTYRERRRSSIRCSARSFASIATARYRTTTLSSAERTPDLKSGAMATETLRPSCSIPSAATSTRTSTGRAAAMN